MNFNWKLSNLYIYFFIWIDIRYARARAHIWLRVYDNETTTKRYYARIRYYPIYNPRTEILRVSTVIIITMLEHRSSAALYCYNGNINGNPRVRRERERQRGRVQWAFAKNLLRPRFLLRFAAAGGAALLQKGRNVEERQETGSCVRHGAIVILARAVTIALAGTYNKRLQRARADRWCRVACTYRDWCARA